MSALIHAGKPGDVAHVSAIAAVLSTVERPRSTLIEELMFRRLSDAAWIALEAKMDLENIQWTAPHIVRFIERKTAEIRDAVLTEGRAAGRAEGRREQQVNAVLAVLEARGLSCSDVVRSRIAACTDTTALDRWLRRAAVAADVDDIFE